LVAQCTTHVVQKKVAAGLQSFAHPAGALGTFQPGWEAACHNHFASHHRAAGWMVGVPTRHRKLWDRLKRRRLEGRWQDMGVEGSEENPSIVGPEGHQSRQRGKRTLIHRFEGLSRPQRGRATGFEIAQLPQALDTGKEGQSDAFHIFRWVSVAAHILEDKSGH
jgi:hypothetical protein